MAISGQEDVNTSNNADQYQNAPVLNSVFKEEDNVRVNNTANNGNSGMNFLGFGGTNFGFIPMKEGSEYTSKVSKALEDAFKKMNKPMSGVEPIIVTLDNSIQTRMVYSVIAVVNRVSETTFHYHYLILEATGTQPFTAREVADKLNNARKQYQNAKAIVDVYVPGDANNATLHNSIAGILKNKFNLGNKQIELVSLDGMVLFREIELTEELYKRIAVISYNSLWGEYFAINNNGTASFNITAYREKGGKDQTPIKGLQFVNENTGNRVSTDALGMPVRADFKIALESQFYNSNNLDINSRGAQMYLTNIKGFVDPIPVEIGRDVNTGYGVQKVFFKKFKPNIVITGIDGILPTAEFMLLGLTSAVVESNITQWPSSLNMNTAGSLNVFTDLSGVVAEGKAVVGEKLNFAKQPFDKTFKLIREMFDPEPMISCDVQASGPETFYTSILAVAASPAMDANSLSNQETARREIVSSAHALTNGKFPMNFPLDKIFVGPGVLVPLGTWEDKTGVRDIREIDYAWLATHTDDTSILQQWALTSTPIDNGGYDPFLTRIEIISRFIDTARITGKAIRVTFTKEFITTLTNACKAAGLDATYTPLITLTDTNANIQVLGNYFSNAGVSGVQFAHMSGGQGANFYTPYAYFQ